MADQARALGRWRQVVAASRILAVLQGEVDPLSSLPRLADVAAEASAHGLTEQAGWAQYSRCETLWLVGQWDEAVAAGLEAVALAERFSYIRLGFRTWIVLLQIASARHDAAMVDHFDRWWEDAANQFPAAPSPYGRLLRAATSIWLAEARGQPVDPPTNDIAECVVSIANPHFMGAIETVVDAWMAAARTDPAAEALRRSIEFSHEPDATVIMKASAALLDARVNASADAARQAVELAAGLPAPWWELRARRALGQPTAELEALLGLTPTAAAGSPRTGGSRADLTNQWATLPEPRHPTEGR
jgi:hypothetical protein